MENLPLDTHIEIVRYLPLQDALSYSQVNMISFDAVYYVFCHRDELDFASVLDANNTIFLSDDKLLTVLHAHTRASVISNFCLSGQFCMHSALESYFTLYWHQCVNMYGTVVGHPAGQLEKFYT